MTEDILGRYLEACQYPGAVNNNMTEAALREYLEVVGIKREVVQISAEFSFGKHIEIADYVGDFLNAFVERNSSLLTAWASQQTQDSRSALDARVARSALDPKEVRGRTALVNRILFDKRRSNDLANPGEDRDNSDDLASLAFRSAWGSQDTINARSILEIMDMQAASQAWRLRSTAPALTAQDSPAARTARSYEQARVAREALAGLDPEQAWGSLEALAKWCILDSDAEWNWRWEMSHLATTYIGAQEANVTEVRKWARPIFEAFISGAWALFWTFETLFWVAKPAVKAEEASSGTRLHASDQPAICSDIKNFYYWHGVQVPSYVIIQPQSITLEQIKNENNVEVRRVMIDRFGLDRWFSQQNTRLIDASADPGQMEAQWYERFGGDEQAQIDWLRTHPEKTIKLYELGEDAYGGRIKMLCVRNGTPEYDGSYKWYWLTPPQNAVGALEAIVATYPGLTISQYLGMVRT